MNEFRKRPKGSFLSEASWSELYVLTRYWKSDLEFYREDLTFLNKLIQKYFIWISTDENYKEVGKLQAELKKVAFQNQDLLEKTKKHLLQLGSMIENETEENNGRLFRIEHEHLENEIVDFVKAFRANRREVFKITEKVIDNEDLSGLMSS